MSKAEQLEKLEKKYDEFFGDGYWEKQYKPHIVEFAEQCLALSEPKGERKEIITEALKMFHADAAVSWTQEACIERFFLNLKRLTPTPELPEECTSWIHQERREKNGDNFCPICGTKLI